jgi:hypothetical protein
MIKLELSPELFGNLRTLLVAGAKSPNTGDMAIMACAQLLQIMDKAAQEASQPKTNGAAHQEQAAPAA